MTHAVEYGEDPLQTYGKLGARLTVEVLIYSSIISLFVKEAKAKYLLWVSPLTILTANTETWDDVVGLITPALSSLLGMDVPTYPQIGVMAMAILCIVLVLISYVREKTVYKLFNVVLFVATLVYLAFVHSVVGMTSLAYYQELSVQKNDLILRSPHFMDYCSKEGFHCYQGKLLPHVKDYDHDYSFSR